jgi:hypothetical protein
MSTPSEHLPLRRSTSRSSVGDVLLHLGPVSEGPAQGADTGGEDDARKEEYESQLAAAIADISSAIDLTEIGGAAVASSLQAAEKFVAARQWGKAMAQLAKVCANADKVNARAPFVQACRQHQGAIKAAFAIAEDGLGKVFKADWEQALKTAEAGQHAAATQAVLTLAGRVEKVKTRPHVKAERETVAKARAQNVADMKQALNAKQVDVVALRKLVLQEIGADGVPSLAARASQLGDDPGAKSREPIGNEAGAEQLFMQNDWFALKDKLHEGTVTTEQMWDCWRYRQQFVTRLIDLLRQDYPTLIAKTSGSTDLESDIDITFASTTPGDDVRAASQFNAIVKAQFGKQPAPECKDNRIPAEYNAKR